MKFPNFAACLSMTLGATACSGALGGGGDALPSDASENPATDAGGGEDGGGKLAPWILTLDNSDDATGHNLARISIAEADYGTVTFVCDEVTLPNSVPTTNIISSLTFNNGRLYASGKGTEDGDTMFLIDPCACTATVVGQYGYTLVAGITSNGVQDMFGISGGEDLVMTIAPATAMGTLLSALGADWGTVGLTWSGAQKDSLWGISGSTDELIEFSASDGTQLNSLVMDFDFTSVGVEYHPGVDTIYACSGSGELLEVNPATGAVKVGPDMGLGTCNNLAAPFGSVQCIE
jgi:hypothetical protein